MCVKKKRRKKKRIRLLPPAITIITTITSIHSFCPFLFFIVDDVCNFFVSLTSRVSENDDDDEKETRTTGERTFELALLRSFANEGFGR
jgi:hypothetical protein